MDCPLCEEMSNRPKDEDGHIEKEDVAQGEYQCVSCHRKVCGWHSSPTQGGRICDDCSTSV